MAFDQATSQFLQSMADQGAPAFHHLSPSDARTFFASLREIIGSGPEMHSSKEVTIPSGDSSISLRLLIPSAQPEGIIVYLHGGGWVIGELDDYDTLGRFIAKESHCAVVLVDYRLAPEHPFPAAVDDSWAALNWVAQHRSEITGVDNPALPLIIAGDSAGGNLAAVTAQRVISEHGPELLMQVLIYPATQANLGAPSYHEPANQTLLTREDMAWFWHHYLPNQRERHNRLASPLLAPSLRGLPPAVVITAEHDVLTAEGHAYADRMENEGVEVHYRQFEGQIHGFFSILNVFPATEKARAFMVEHIKRQLNTSR